MTDSNPSEQVSVAAVLVRRSREDRDALMEDLVGLLSGVAPDAEIRRTLFGRRVKSVRCPVGESVFVLARSGRSFEAARQQQVRGVVVRTIPMEVDAFLNELGVALDAELQRSEQGRAALQKWMNT